MSSVIAPAAVLTNDSSKPAGSPARQMQRRYAVWTYRTKTHRVEDVAALQVLQALILIGRLRRAHVLGFVLGRRPALGVVVRPIDDKVIPRSALREKQPGSSYEDCRMSDREKGSKARLGKSSGPAARNIPLQ